MPNKCHPLVPEIKSFSMEEMMKRGYRKLLHPDGRVEHVMTPEVQALFKASPEYKEFLRRSGGTGFTPGPNVQLKIVGKEEMMAGNNIEKSIEKSLARNIEKIPMETVEKIPMKTAENTFAKIRDTANIVENENRDINEVVGNEQRDTAKSNVESKTVDTCENKTIEIEDEKATESTNPVSKRVLNSDKVGSKRRRV